MRIVIHDYAGFPFPLELSSEMAQRGHHVLHLFTEACGGPKASSNNKNSKNFKVVNINAYQVDKDNLIKRWIQERKYGNLAINNLECWHPDVIVSGNTPLEAQKKIIGWANAYAVPSIFWLQDLLSVAAGAILSKINGIISFFVFNYLKRLEISALSQASHIVSITEDFFPFLNRWNIDTSKVSVIPNWGPIEQIPVISRHNYFSDFFGLNEKFVLLYAGTLGKKQDIRLITDIAVHLADDDEIRFVVATDERGHRLLEQALAHKHVANLLKLPLQSTNQYPYLLASSDATLVTLDRSTDMYCVPSKLWSSYCAQRPSVVSVDSLNPCARITRDINAGIVVPPGSTDQCITAIKKLKMHPSIRLDMGKNARRYAEEHFPIVHIADQFEAIINQIVDRTNQCK